MKIMGVNLTPGAISMVSRSGECDEIDDLKPVVQVVDILCFNPLTRDGRVVKDWNVYTLVLSDGSVCQKASIGYGSPVHKLVISNQLQKGSVVQLTQYYTSIPDVILSVCDVHVILTKCDIIGDPKPYPHNKTSSIENIDDSRHVEEPPTLKQKPSASTQKCSSHSITQNNTDTIMGVNLTPGAITKIMTDKCSSTDLKPVVQVTYILSALISTKNDKQCYRKIVLSDGSSSHFGCIADDIFISNKLQKGSIVQLTKFHFTKFSIYGNIRVLLVNDLNVIRSKSDIIVNPELFPRTDIPLVERSTPPIADEDHVDVSHHAQESLTSTQKCSETQSRKQKHQSSNETPESDTNEDVDNSHDAQEPSATTQKCSSHFLTQSKKRKHQSSNDNISKVVEDVSKMAKVMMDKNKKDDVCACFKKLETLEEDVSKLTRMMIEKNKEDDIGACIEKLDKMGWGAEEPIYDTALLLFGQSANYRKLWLHLKPESCGKWVKNAGIMFGLLD